MNRQKSGILIFYILFIIGSALLVFFAKNLYGIIQIDAITEAVSEKYLALQKQLSYLSISVFILLLMVSFYLFFTTKNKNPILLSNILYIGVTLFVFVSCNKQFYIIKSGVASQNSAYWLYLFIGIFYILGAILVSAIGFITIKNYINRHSDPANKNRRSRITP